MLRNMEVNLLLSALLVCSWGGRAQELMSPNVNIIAELEKIKNIEERLNSQDMTVTLLTSSVEELKRENTALKTMADSFQEKLESLQQENIALKMKVDTLENENEVRKVAFSASLLASGIGQTGPFSPVNSPLIYKKVVTNYGNGYDSNTGIFTAPLKGVYYLRFYAHSHDGIKMAVSLYKNDQRQCSVYSHKPVANGNAGNGIVLTLMKGDRIYIKLWDKSWVYDDPASYTSFGGFLLFPL